MATKRRRTSTGRDPLQTVWPFGDHHSGAGPQDASYYRSRRLGTVFVLAAIWGIALCLVILIGALIVNL
jgi:hypothetical protein